MTRPTALMAAALLAVAGGCASLQAAGAREKALRLQLDAFRYAKPLDEVWPEVQRLLNDRRYGLVGKDAEALGLDVPTGLLTYLTMAKETQPDGFGGRFLETGWGPGLVRRRYRVEGSPAGSGCRVVFTAIPEDMTEKGHDARERARDLEMELALAWRVDPQAAERIEASLEAAGEARPARP
jgi:hypothetical protein